MVVLRHQYPVCIGCRKVRRTCNNISGTRLPFYRHLSNTSHTNIFCNIDTRQRNFSYPKHIFDHSGHNIRPPFHDNRHPFCGYHSRDAHKCIAIRELYDRRSNVRVFPNKLFLHVFWSSLFCMWFRQ